MYTILGFCASLRWTKKEWLSIMINTFSATDIFEISEITFDDRNLLKTVLF